MAVRKEADGQNPTGAPSLTVFTCKDVAIAIVLLGLAVRSAVGISPYSGANDPPKYGDYEAQRHWMELTVNLPVDQWYTASPNWWPLDYPPLSGYQSWLCGKAFQLFEPAAVEWDTSRGYETKSSKRFMRATVVASDLLVFIPAAWLCATIFFPAPSSTSTPTSKPCPPSISSLPRSHAHLLMWAAVLLQPAAILVDHGHFQYNTIGLGLAAAAAAAVAGGHHLVGSVLFCLSMNHKQMGLFYAPAFFAHLLGRALERPGLSGKAVAVAKLGVVVIATFAVSWAPYLSREGLLQVISRVLPVKRGLYEDYVANFWCSTSVAIKWKDLFDQAVLIKACAAGTLLASSSAMLQQIMRPSSKGLLLCMCNSAMAFFMFAFHVHEKSILLPLLSATLLAPSDPFWAAWAPIVGSFSMFPLLVRDGVALPYCGCLILYFAIMLPVLNGGNTINCTSLPSESTPPSPSPSPSRAKTTGGGILANWGPVVEKYAPYVKMLLVYPSLLLFVLLHVGKEFVPPPANLPWLYDRLFITLAFVHFALMQVHLNVLQWLGTPVRQEEGRM